MKRAAVFALLLLPFLLPPCFLRAETARVDVNAGLGPSSVTVEVEDGYARLTVLHAAPSDAAAWVDGPDGRTELTGETAGTWVCIRDCPVVPAPSPVRYVSLERR